MSATIIASIYAFAEIPGIPPDLSSEHTVADLTELIEEVPATEVSAPEVSTMCDPAIPEARAPGGDPDLWLYRKRTVGLLRRYMRLSIEVGRLPSLLGREFFRTRVTSYRTSTFEDSVIFVHDVEKSLEELDDFQKNLIAKIVLQEYPQEEAARQLGCGQRHAARCYVEALDRVSETFLRRRLLLRLPVVKPPVEKTCQGGKADVFELSNSKQVENKV